MTQAHVYGSMKPVNGCLPWDQAAVSESIALRVGGMIIDACESTSGTGITRRADMAIDHCYCGTSVDGRCTAEAHTELLRCLTPL